MRGVALLRASAAILLGLMASTLFGSCFHAEIAALQAVFAWAIKA